MSREIPKYDIYPENIIMLRHIDVGVKIVKSNGETIKVQI